MRWLAIAVAVLAAVGAVLAVVLGAQGGSLTSEPEEQVGPPPPMAIAPPRARADVEEKKEPEPAPVEKPVEATPSAPAVRSLDAAPGKFTLGSEHRLYIDRFHTLPPLSMRIEMDAPYRVVFQSDPGEGLRRKEVELPVFLFTRTRKGLEAKRAQGTFQWNGTMGWLLSMRSAHLPVKVVTNPSAWDKQSLQHAKSVRGPNAEAMEGNDIEIDRATVESTNQYRVRSLAAANTWRLTLTPKAEAGESVYPIVFQAMPRPELTRDVFLDGKPLESTMALVSPGSHKLFGAAELWLSMIAVEGANAAEVEVELSALTAEPEPSLKARGLDESQATFQRDKKYKQGGAWRCERISAVLSAGTTGKKLSPVLEVQFKDVPPLLIEVPPPEPVKTSGIEGRTAMLDVGNVLRQQLSECQNAGRLLRAARMKQNATVETTAGKRSGTFVRYNDVVGH